MAGVRLETKVYFRDSLGRFASAVEAGAEAAQEEIGVEGARMAGELAPKKTGALAAGIHSIGGGAWATPALRYAMDQEFGAGAHVIGENGEFLANEGDGFAAKGPVWHPGNPAVHYMKRSYDFMKTRALSITKRHMP